MGPERTKHYRPSKDWLTSCWFIQAVSHDCYHRRCSYPAAPEFTAQTNTWISTLPEERAWNTGAAHIGAAATTCVLLPTIRSSMPAKNDFAVTVQINPPGKAEIAVRYVWTYTCGVVWDPTVSYGYWRVLWR